MKVNHRGYTTGFYFNSQSQDNQLYEYSTHACTYQMAGFICGRCKDNKLKIDVRNQIVIGDQVEIFSKTAQVDSTKVLTLWNGDLEPVGTLHPGTIGYLETDKPLKKYDIIRKVIE